MRTFFLLYVVPYNALCKSDGAMYAFGKRCCLTQRCCLRGDVCLRHDMCKILCDIKKP